MLGFEIVYANKTYAVSTSVFPVWNGTEPGWVVHCHIRNLQCLEIVFTDTGPTLTDIKALRVVVPGFADKPPGEILALLRKAKRFPLGEHESSYARKLIQLCVAHGLQVDSNGGQLVLYRLVNQISKRDLMINDDISCLVAEEAIRQGLRVIHSEE
ncbi:hypothetical protein H8L32_16450 [Undibacterium sp. CY18W]|uniref:Uncharacterized protein n=1 Tax=Undibacterium hunanense TaxID=2762292 RepID=A0ABR6ZT99_9BURK|nr:hypothetical protein [Undibacterium hunanense]MBC3919083.1 hypothetical protein [Undibacterium hunanense]